MEKIKERIIYRIRQIAARRHAASLICNAAVLLHTRTTSGWLHGAKVVFHASPLSAEQSLSFQEEMERGSSADKRVSLRFEGNQQLARHYDELQILSAELGMGMKISIEMLKNKKLRRTEEILEKMRRKNVRVLNDGTLLRTNTKRAEIEKFLRNKKLLENKKFYTKAHAELILIWHFDTHEITYYGHDRYVGCSQPACHLCLQYIRAMNEMYKKEGKPSLIEPHTHDVVYMEWRPPESDIFAGSTKTEALSLRRNEVLEKMIAANITAIKKSLADKRGVSGGRTSTADSSRITQILAKQKDPVSKGTGKGSKPLDSDGRDLGKLINSFLTVCPC